VPVDEERAARDDVHRISGVTLLDDDFAALGRSRHPGCRDQLPLARGEASKQRYGAEELDPLSGRQLAA
jgi:hypothetical protein